MQDTIFSTILVSFDWKVSSDCKSASCTCACSTFALLSADLHETDKPNSRHLKARIRSQNRSFFFLAASCYGVPGGSSFSQLQRREKNNSRSWKSNKNIHDHWQWNELIKQIQKPVLRERVRQRRESRSGVSLWRTNKKEDRRREAMGLSERRNRLRRRKHRWR